MYLMTQHPVCVCALFLDVCVPYNCRGKLEQICVNCYMLSVHVEATCTCTYVPTFVYLMCTVIHTCTCIHVYVHVHVCV